MNEVGLRLPDINNGNNKPKVAQKTTRDDLKLPSLVVKFYFNKIDLLRFVYQVD